MKMGDLIGKTVTGVVTVNAKDGGTVIDSLRLEFSDGAELSVANDYIDGFGWTTLEVTLRKGGKCE